MFPNRDTFITTLIQSKLHLRRMYRAWRRPTQRQKKTSISSSSPALPVSHSQEKYSSTSYHAQLPCSPPDQYPYVKFIPLLLFFVSLILRLYHISYPSSVVFDEVHFLRFVRAYYYGEYFFDIHPPLGKLILLAITYIFCGPPEKAFKSNDLPFGDFHYMPLRITSALFGSTISPLTFLICRQMGLSLPASIFPALAQVVENVSLTESRLILLDSQLMSFTALCLLLALQMWARPRGKRWGLVIGTALAGAAAISVKWTALATPGIIAIISLIGKPFPTSRLLLSEMSLAGIIAFAFYTANFWIHFKLLPKAGEGDPFMRKVFRRALPGDEYFEPGAKMPNFWKNFTWLNWQMFVANKGVSKTHPWGSRWYQWVTNQRGLMYFNEAKGKYFEINEKIYLVVSPAITIFTIVAMLSSVSIIIGFYAPRLFKGWALIRSAKTRMHGFTERTFILCAGFVLNLIPYIGKFTSIINYDYAFIS